MTATECRVPPYAGLRECSARGFAEWSAGYLPDWLGIDLLHVAPDRLTCRARVRQALMAPHGYLHGGTVVAIADTMCGYGAITNLPDGAAGFVTIELKNNFLGTLRDGALVCEARPVHLGRTTQVWDATVSDERTGRVIARFRCTQLVMWEHD